MSKVLILFSQFVVYGRFCDFWLAPIFVVYLNVFFQFVVFMFCDACGCPHEEEDTYTSYNEEEDTYTQPCTRQHVL